MAYLEKWRGRALKDRCDMAELFLDIIRPLKGYFSPGHAWLKVGYTRALRRKGSENGGLCQAALGAWTFMGPGE